MSKTVRIRIVPFLLIMLVFMGMFPISASAESPPNITISDNDGNPADSSTPEISVEPGAPSSEPPNSESSPSSSSTQGEKPETGSYPDSSIPPESQSGQDSSSSSTKPESGSDDKDTDSNTKTRTLEGAAVEILPSGMMGRSVAPRASGTLSIHKYPEYQWDFGFSHGGTDIKPWYIMEISGRLAYCVEPTNPETNAGEYGTITWDDLNSSQKYAIGYAMLYGAQDKSNPLLHMATQTIIWEIVYGYMDLTGYTTINKHCYNATIGHNPAAAGMYESILTKMRNHTQVPSFTRVVKSLAPTHKVSGIPGEYKVDLVNTNPHCSLADFYFANSGTVSFVRDQETLKVTSSGPLNASTIYGGFKGARAETESLIFWGRGNEQIRATAGLLDPVPAYFRLSTEDVGEYQITVRKFQTGTNNPLAGAEFEVRHAEKGVIGRYTTDGSGRLVVSVPWQGTYIITEITPPKNHELARNPIKDVVITTDKPNAEVTFHNDPYAGIQITKVDATTKQRIPGVTFRIARKGGGEAQEVVTGAAGIATLPNLKPDWYTIQEISCPPGYILDSQIRTVEVKTNEICEITIENYAKPSLEIKKVDEDTGVPLAGATFRVAKRGGKEFVDIISGFDGVARLPGMEPDYYTVTEIVAPDGYILSTQQHTIEIIEGKVATITITNSKKPGLEIMKLDEDTGAPLAGATFRIAKRGGKEYMDIVSGPDGIARLTGMEPDYYIVTEIVAPEGYILDSREHTLEIAKGKVATITLNNQKKPSLEILKVDTITKQPLAYAVFKISYKNGEVIGEFTTDENGRIFFDAMDPGLVVVEEITAPDGYIILNAPQEILLKGGEAKTLTFENKPKSPVIIKKIDSATGEPLSGATFRLTKMNGELIGEYKTGRNGFITIPELEPGWYIAVEIKSPEGYKLNDTPKNIQLKLGEPAIVEFENTLLPGLQIKKVDAITGKPLAGVTIRLTKMSGDVIGEYKTNEAGLLFAGDLQPGWYTAYEIETIDGYMLDTTPQNVELKAGKSATLTFKNYAYPYLVIRKLDKDTKAPLAGVKFKLFGNDGREIGTYLTDSTGRIVLTGIPAGNYKIQEVEAAPGYWLDDRVWDITLEWGRTTTVTFTNILEKGQIQIVKVAAEDNELTGANKGDKLAGAVFEILNDKLEVVDTITTDERGVATSKSLPLGKYTVKEVKSPDYWLINGKEFPAEIKTHSDLIRFVVEDAAVKIDTTVEKRGVVEAVPGSSIQYDYKNIANTSNVPLEDFYWHDLLPTDAVRLESIYTGTWNQQLTYKVVYRTNLKDGWSVLADNLLTKNNNHLDCSPNALKLAANEYVTEFKFLFGKVKAGFREEKAPYIFVRVLPDLPDGYTFVNRTDVGGRYGEKWTYDKDAWVSIIYKTPEAKGKLPKTGIGV